MDAQPLRFILAGQFRRDYLLPPTAAPFVEVPGGNLLYAAAGMSLWEQGIGLLGRIPTDYPPDWLEKMRLCGLDTRGIRPVQEEVDVRLFITQDEAGEAAFDNPVARFAQAGHPFPKGLLGYRETLPTLDSRTRLGPLSIRLADIPVDFLDAAAAHICPVDYLTHSLLPPALRQGHITTLTLDPSPGYMNPVFFNNIPALLSSLTAFLTTENKLRSLFQGRSTDPLEMAEALAEYGCELIIIRRGTQGQIVYESAAHRGWHIPAYPGRRFNPTGAGDAFCGGFLAGWRASYDPIQAALQGNISASIVIESCDPFYAFNSMPGLAQARLEALKERITPL